MNNIYKFAIITPSYSLDFARCKLLWKSINKFVTPSVNHYIIVDKKDLSLFQQLKNQKTFIITKESLLPWWIQRLPLPQNLWLSLKTNFLRGWVIQQIVKIAAVQQISVDIPILIDSDVVFVRPFNLESLVRQEKVRFFCDPIGNQLQKKMHHIWHKSASQLLGLSDIDATIPDYIGQIMTWRRENVIQMCQRIENISGKSWIETLANTWHISEYVLYGIFVRSILKDKSQHYYDEQSLTLNYWFPQPLSEKELQNFLTNLSDKQVAVMISAKAGIPVEQYRSLLDQLDFSLKLRERGKKV
jgi:hypothetical protein